VADLDLTEAVESAARAYAVSGPHGIVWDELTPLHQHGYRSAVAPIVAAAAPLIAAQARREALEGLAERLQDADGRLLDAYVTASDLAEMARLKGKAEGVRLALGVIEEALR